MAGYRRVVQVEWKEDLESEEARSAAVTSLCMAVPTVVLAVPMPSNHLGETFPVVEVDHTAARTVGENCYFCEQGHCGADELCRGTWCSPNTVCAYLIRGEGS